MIILAHPSRDFLKNSFHQVESPLVLDQGTQHLLCPCMYMHLLHVDTCASPHTGKVELGTPNRTPQNHDLPIWLAADSSVSWSREVGPGKD